MLRISMDKLGSVYNKNNKYGILFRVASVFIASLILLFVCYFPKIPFPVFFERINRF